MALLGIKLLSPNIEGTGLTLKLDVSDEPFDDVAFLFHLSGATCDISTVVKRRINPSEWVNRSALNPIQGAIAKLTGGIIRAAADPMNTGPTIHTVQHRPSINSLQPSSLRLYSHHNAKLEIEFEVAAIDPRAWISICSITPR
jgi:hypothetical protein